MADQDGTFNQTLVFGGLLVTDWLVYNGSKGMVFALGTFVTGAIKIDVSPDKVDIVEDKNISLTENDFEPFSINAPQLYIRARLDGILLSQRADR